MAKTEERILNGGEPMEILGIVKIERIQYLLVKWNTGKAYVPYEFFKSNYPMMLMEYYARNHEFRSLQDD